MNELTTEWVEKMDRYSVRFRYPGESADKEEARRAFETSKLVRRFMRAKLGLPAG